jgi:hypothetical protein
VEEERIKSALEIAMEKLSGLPELTPEEIVEQKKKEYEPIGEALGNRYMRDMIDGKSLLSELRRHQEDEALIIRQALVSTLSASIGLENLQASEKALEGILEATEGREDWKEKAFSFWNRLSGDFERQLKAKAGELETAAREYLKSLGVSGSAIRPNLAENERVKQRLDDLRRSFDPELEKLKVMLVEKA